MTPEQVDALLGTLRAGRTLEVPFSTRLFADTRAGPSTLHMRADGSLELATEFHEFAPGHGWSVAQTERETLEWDEARARLLGAAPNAVKRA